MILQKPSQMMTFISGQSFPYLPLTSVKFEVFEMTYKNHKARLLATFNQLFYHCLLPQWCSSHTDLLGDFPYAPNTFLVEDFALAVCSAYNVLFSDTFLTGSHPSFRGPL